MPKYTAKSKNGRQKKLQNTKSKTQSTNIPEKSTTKKVPIKRTNIKQIENVSREYYPDKMKRNDNVSHKCYTNKMKRNNVGQEYYPDKMKRIENVCPEYYPDKMKRSTRVKKVVMKPKCHLKVIGGIRRRKLYTPVKGRQADGPPNRVTSPVLSDSDWEPHIAIQEAELAWDSEEDLMEILTCPSPVWWEDPPSEEYSEEPIFLKTQVDVIEETHQATNTTEAVNIKVKINKKDKKFIEKRSKLENVLGNIKNKILDEESITFDESLIIDLENIKIPIANTRKASAPCYLPPLKRRSVKNLQSDSISDKDVMFLDDSETSTVKNDRRQSRRIKTLGDGEYNRKDDFFYFKESKNTKPSPKKGKRVNSSSHGKRSPFPTELRRHS